MIEIKTFLKKYRLFLFMLSLLLIKQFLVTGIPLFAHSGAGHDDRLMVDMADSLLKGEWLGVYFERTLVKGLFFPLFLAVNRILAIPYSIALPAFYGFGCIIFILGIKKLFKSEFPLYLIFVMLVFNPISFADETYLRVYRNSLSAAQTLILTGSLIGLYLNRFEKISLIAFWAMLSSFGLASLWHTREDGIWIMPFVLVVIVITLASIFLKGPLPDKIGDKLKRSIWVIAPLLLLFLSSTFISLINQSYYGIYTTNELNNSHFTDTIKLIYAVKADEDVYRCSVPRSTMAKLYHVSPSLKSIEDELEASLDRWSWYDKDAPVRQVEDGFFFWAFREAIAEAGYYENAQKANDFYAQIYEELNEAFEKGLLEKRRTMPSALMSPWQSRFFRELPLGFLKTVHYIAGFEAIEISINDSIDDGNKGIRLFEKVTASLAQYPGEAIRFQDSFRLKILNGIILIYQFMGRFLFLLAAISYAVLTIFVLVKKWRVNYEVIDVWLVLSGLLASVFVLALGVAYTDISAYVAISYWYLGGAYPLIVVFNIVAIYKIFEIIAYLYLKKPGNRLGGI